MKNVRNNNLMKILSLTSFLFLVACNSASGNDYSRKTINHSKLCVEVKYKCLAESKNKQWRESLLSNERLLFSRDLLWQRLAVIEKLFEHRKVDKGVDEKGRRAFSQLRNKVLEYGDSLHMKAPNDINQDMAKKALSLAAEFMNKTEDELVSDEFYQMTDREEHDIKLRKKQRWYTEITQFVGLLYPDFWGDTPEKEQIKWVMKAESIARKYDPESSSRGGIEIMAGICGIIGTDFESNPVHKSVVDYLSTISKSNVGQLSQTWDYLNFAYIENDFSFSGRRYSSWALRDALTHLPIPKREVPRLSDLPEDRMYHEPSDIWKVYKSTVRNGGNKK